MPIEPMPCVPVSGGEIIEVELVGWTSSTTTAVPASLTSVTLAPANPSRKGIFFYNSSTATLKVFFGTPATLSLFTVSLGANSSYEFQSPTYNGIITGIWDGDNGNVLVTEGS